MTTIERSPPRSPPELTRSRSSKCSSFHSSTLSDIVECLQDESHFDEVSLDDGPCSNQSDPESDSTPSNVSKTPSRSPPRYPPPPLARSRSSAHMSKSPKDLTISTRPSLPTLKTQLSGALRGGPPPSSAGRRALRRGYTSPSSSRTPTASSPSSQSSSPIESPLSSSSVHFRKPLYSLDLAAELDKFAIYQRPVRRGLWQPGRKTLKELEAECNDESNDDIPEDAIFWNVPITPRAMQESPPSRSAEKGGVTKLSKSDLNVRVHRPAPVPERMRTGAAQRPRMAHSVSVTGVPEMGSLANVQRTLRSKALRDLSEEAQLLTQALQAYAAKAESRHVEQVSKYAAAQRPVLDSARTTSTRLPPVLKSNVLMDPLPISKEKEKMLCRTRPSWLPPKCPKEDQRHVKQYQEMMALAHEAEKRKAAQAHSPRPSPSSTDSSPSSHFWPTLLSPHRPSTSTLAHALTHARNDLPPTLRGPLYSRAIGNGLRLPSTTYPALLARARALDRKFAALDPASRAGIREALTFDEIRGAAAGVWPELGVFHQEGGGEGGKGGIRERLVDVLMAWAVWRPDVGGVGLGLERGVVRAAGLFLLNMDAGRAFVALANLFASTGNASSGVGGTFLERDERGMAGWYAEVLREMKKEGGVPKLYERVRGWKMHPRRYLDMVLGSLGIGGLSGAEEAMRVWDVVLLGDMAEREGRESGGEGGDEGREGEGREGREGRERKGNEGKEKGGALVSVVLALLRCMEGRLLEASEEEVVRMMGWGNEGGWGLSREEVVAGIGGTGVR